MNAPAPFVADIGTRHDPSRKIAAPTGTALTCKSWLTEAPFRMIQNNLHPDGRCAVRTSS